MGASGAKYGLMTAHLININLRWGAVMLLFGSVMLFLPRRSAHKK